MPPSVVLQHQRKHGILRQCRSVLPLPDPGAQGASSGMEIRLQQRDTCGRGDQGHAVSDPSSPQCPGTLPCARGNSCDQSLDTGTRQVVCGEDSRTRSLDRNRHATHQCHDMVAQCHRIHPHLSRLIVPVRTSDGQCGEFATVDASTERGLMMWVVGRRAPGMPHRQSS